MVNIMVRTKSEATLYLNYNLFLLYMMVYNDDNNTKHSLRSYFKAIENILFSMAIIQRTYIEIQCRTAFPVASIGIILFVVFFSPIHPLVPTEPLLVLAEGLEVHGHLRGLQTLFCKLENSHLTEEQGFRLIINQLLNLSSGIALDDEVRNELLARFEGLENSSLCAEERYRVVLDLVQHRTRIREKHLLFFFNNSNYVSVTRYEYIQKVLLLAHTKDGTPIVRQYIYEQCVALHVHEGKSNPILTFIVLTSVSTLAGVMISLYLISVSN